MQKLSRAKKVFFFVSVIIFSIPAGGLLGGFLGLVSTTFIPQCCDDSGCCNCLEFNGMTGYEAAGYLGFWIGLVLFPLICSAAILYWTRKKNNKSG
ncbi:MAG: hypothetical protein U5L10_02740 [Candidatus Moranbacteria bacterium]|nr:hypothetical protein [Candidatus Moranbacteria bacterium]